MEGKAIAKLTVKQDTSNYYTMSHSGQNPRRPFTSFVGNPINPGPFPAINYFLVYPCTDINTSPPSANFRYPFYSGAIPYNVFDDNWQHKWPGGWYRTRDRVVNNQLFNQRCQWHNRDIDFTQSGPGVRWRIPCNIVTGERMNQNDAIPVNPNQLDAADLSTFLAVSEFYDLGWHDRMTIPELKTAFAVFIGISKLDLFPKHMIAVTEIY